MAQLTPHEPDIEAEKRESEAILSSGLFEPNSNPGKLLRYLCDKYFAQQADEIKEYTIAVDVFSRPASFDNRRDSIVRVEASRLRKRLEEYYAGDGSGHALRIVIPPGQYVPQFVRQSGAEVEIPAPPAEPGVSTAWWWFAAGAVLSGLVGLFVYMQSGSASEAANAPARQEAATVAESATANNALRILAGYDRAPHVDRAGNIWLPDRYFEGGQAVPVRVNYIGRTLDTKLFENMRTGPEFAYHIPLNPGIYELRLHFSETTYGPGLVRGGGEASRLMILRINGERVLYSFDVYGVAGGDHLAEVRVFRDISPAEDGKLHLEFSANWDRPFVNAIEILPSERGKIRPIRLTARDSAYADREGRIWSPDSYFMGGRLELRKDPPGGASDPGLYLGERYGRFSYSIPVAPGKYRVTLHFAENWFKEGTGKRVFEVWCNGSTLLQNFDIAREAGGAMRTIQKTFTGIRPTSYGKIELTFMPVVNYALVNAIEILDESGN